MEQSYNHDVLHPKMSSELRIPISLAFSFVQNVKFKRLYKVYRLFTTFLLYVPNLVILTLILFF